MKLYYAGFCVWLLLLMVMLSSCSEFEAKIEEMNIMTQPALDEQMHKNDGLQQ